jgi:long-subunit fatty acid transport protein
LRLENRFIHKNINTDETQNWFRYFLNVNYPINENWSAYIFNEIFLNLDRSEVFAKNWTGAGLLRKINKNLKVKFGSFQIKQNSRTLKRIRVGLLLNTDFF